MDDMAWRLRIQIPDSRGWGNFFGFFVVKSYRYCHHFVWALPGYVLLLLLRLGTSQKAQSPALSVQLRTPKPQRGHPLSIFVTNLGINAEVYIIHNMCD